MISTKNLPRSFETERLLLRSPRKGDGAMINEAVRESFKAITPWLPWAKTLPTVDETEAFAVDAEEGFARAESFNILLFRKDTGRYVGNAGIPRLNWSIPSFEIGYWVRTSEQGRGFISEAVTEVTRQAFEVLGARRVEIFCDAKNVSSASVAERAGFDLEGILKNHRVRNDGTIGDTRVYARTFFETTL
ncbi:MAG: GNAT family N-acetyltransferase [Bdellovibrionales bacterium]|nr:GNAT family N-acetyltransferase [Bdellovibrionales bacterium]